MKVISEIRNDHIVRKVTRYDENDGLLKGCEINFIEEMIRLESSDNWHVNDRIDIFKDNKYRMTFAGGIDTYFKTAKGVTVLTYNGGITIFNTANGKCFNEECDFDIYGDDVTIKVNKDNIIVKGSGCYLGEENTEILFGYRLTPTLELIDSKINVKKETE